MSSTAPDLLGAPVRAVLSGGEHDDLDATSILDVLWLAATMDAAARADRGATRPDLRDAPYRGRRRIGSLAASPDEERLWAEEAERRDRSGGPDIARVFDPYNNGPWAAGEGIRARRVRLGGQGALPGKLELARALRPLRQSFPSRHHMVLDVEATVRATASAGHTLPVLRAAKERRFSVDLVFDVSPSMLVWWGAFAELATVFRHVGAFRDVKQWQLRADAEHVWLTDRSGRHWPPSALRSADRRRITLIVTDAVAGHWYAPRLWQHLTDWGMSHPVALLDLLPLKLWNFSGIGPNRVRVRANSFAAPNAELKFNVPRRWRLAGRPAEAALPFPVVELSPAALAGWSAMVATAHPAGSPALLVESDPPYRMTEAPPARSDGAVSLKNFMHTASPGALRLAVMAATSDSTTLTVLQAIQRELLPGSPISDLAEVLVSGIYQHVPDGQDSDLHIHMDPGCRAELQKQASPQDRWDVYRAVSRVIQRGDPASAASFQAAIHDVSGDITLPRRQQAFAEMARTALAQLEALPPQAASHGVSRQEEEEGSAPPSSSAVISAETDPPVERDFFISYTQADKAWAEWIAWVLEENGSRVFLAARDLRPGSDLRQAIGDAIDGSTRLIAVVSPDYLTSAWTQFELDAALAKDPDAQPRRLVPVVVRETQRTGLLVSVVGIDLFGLSERDAEARLLTLLERSTPASSTAVPGLAVPGLAVPGSAAFPGQTRTGEPPPFPGTPPSESPSVGKRPSISNLPPRNRYFSGREAELAALADGLTRQPTLTVRPVLGLGGVGKTQLVIEFAHRHAADYDLVYCIAADESALLLDQFAALAIRLGLEPAADPEVLQFQVHNRLRSVRGWLLIFDNADDVTEIRPWLPKAPMPPDVPGHVIVTTRKSSFAALGSVLQLDIFDDEAAERFLQIRLPSIDPETGRQIASELGRLPLALEQAAAYMNATGIPGQEYLELLRTRGAELYTRGGPGGPQSTIGTLWSLTTERIRQENPAAVQLLEICAYLAPEPIPLDLFTTSPTLLPHPLSSAAADPLVFTEAVALLTGYSMAAKQRDGLILHRLVQAVIRAQPEASDSSGRPPASSGATADQDGRAEAHPLAIALDLLRADAPEQVAFRPEAWPRWAVLLPHVLAATSHHEEVQPSTPARSAEAAQLLDGAGIYLSVHGQFADARPLLERAVALTEAAYGPDHPDLAGHLKNLALILGDLGRPREAQPLAERALAIDEAALGPDQPAIAADLGTLAQIYMGLNRLEEAGSLAQRALVIDEAVHGPNHPNVAQDLGTLAQIYMGLSRLDDARSLAQRALAIDEAVYGPDHPEVSRDLSDLAQILQGLGQSEEARPLAERALAISERALGPDHPYTRGARQALDSLTGK